MPKLTVSIVNYNAGEYIYRCLQSLEKVLDEVSMEVYIIDNASVDGSIEKLKNHKWKLEISYILNDQNLGFGKAHNQVLKNLKTEYVLILNPDVELEKGVLEKTITFMDANPEVGVTTCKILQSDGEIDWASHRGFPTPWASFMYYFMKDDSLYHLSMEDMNVDHEVDAVSGSFLLTRKSILDKVGIFDEDYFMYAEDIDLCFRIKEAGFKIMYLPEVKIIHHKGISSGLKKHSQGQTTATLETKKRSLDSFYETMKIFYKKHLAKKYPGFINWLVYMGIDLKWFLAKSKLTV